MVVEKGHYDPFDRLPLSSLVAHPSALETRELAVVVDKRSYAEVLVKSRQCRGSFVYLDAQVSKAQSVNSWKAYAERNANVSRISVDHVCATEGMSGNVKDVSIVLHSLKKQLEDLRGEVDHLIGEANEA